MGGGLLEETYQAAKYQSKLLNSSMAKEAKSYVGKTVRRNVLYIKMETLTGLVQSPWKVASIRTSSQDEELQRTLFMYRTCGHTQAKVLETGKLITQYITLLYFNLYTSILKKNIIR